VKCFDFQNEKSEKPVPCVHTKASSDGREDIFAKMKGRSYTQLGNRCNEGRTHTESVLKGGA
jgi:hypothetical protein